MRDPGDPGHPPEAEPHLDSGGVKLWVTAELYSDVVSEDTASRVIHMQEGFAKSI